MLAPRITFGIAALLLATSGWGGMFLVSKDGLQHVDPVWFTLIRYSLSGLLFVVLLLPRGLAHSVPSHGAVIMATMPMTTQLLRWALDGARPNRSAVLTTALALAGVVIVSGVLTASARSEASTLPGDALILLGTLGWIGYTRGAAKFPALDVLDYSALTVIASWPLLLLGALLATASGLSTLPGTADLLPSWHALLYVGVISSAVSVLAFNFGVRALGAVTATAFLNFVPVSALLMSVALGKPPSLNELLGTTMVVGALLIHTALNRGTQAPLRNPAPIRPMHRVGEVAHRVGLVQEPLVERRLHS